MDFDHESGGSCGSGGQGHRCYVIPMSCSVAGVDDDGQVGQFVEDGYYTQVQGVAGFGFEGADAAFAHDDFAVPFGHDVFGGHEPFADGGHHAAFQEYGAFGFADGFEETVILHVAGADLENIGVFGNEIDLIGGHDFGDEWESGGFAGFFEEFESFFFQTLEAVGGGAWFVGSAAQDLRPRFFDGMGCFKDLVPIFHGTGAGHNAEGITADGGGADFNDSIFGVGFPPGQLI